MSEKTSGLTAMKVALFSSAIAYVLLGAATPFTVEPGLDLVGAAMRQILIFFCLTALGLMLFQNIRALRLGAGLLGLAGAIELIQFAPVLQRHADALDVFSAGAGILIALAPVVIGREFPLQSKGASPTSLSFLP